MSLFFADGSPFVTGSQSNVYYEPTAQERKARLILRVTIEGIMTQAMVDTGGLYLFCSPRVARLPALDEAEALGTQTIIFREERVRGSLHRLTLTLLAEEGDDLRIDTTTLDEGPYSQACSGRTHPGRRIPYGQSCQDCH